MALHLICGRSHSGKSTYISDKIAQLISQNKKVVILVPEQFNHIAEKRLLKKVGFILDDSIEITSFNRLAMRTRDMAGDMRDSIITPTGKSIIMTSAIEQCELQYFKSVCEQPGFTDTCINCISEFKKYGVDTAAINDVINKIDNEVLKYKLSDLCKIYDCYEKLMLNNYIDTDDILNILNELLEQNDFYKDTVFFLDEFSTFIPQEEKIISQLIKKSKDVYVTLCMDKDLTKDLFIPTVTTYNKLVDLCRENHFEIEDTLWLDNTYYSSDLVSFAEKNLFSYPTKTYLQDTNSIKLVKAQNPYSEVDNAARHILNLVKDGLRFNDICIICSDINRYNNIFKNVFKEYNIPYFIDEKTPVLKHQIVMFVISIIDVYLNNYSYESIFNFIKSGFADVDAVSVALLDNFILKTNVSKNTWFDDDRWQTIIQNYEASEKTINKITEIRNNIILPLGEFHNKIKGRNSAKYLIECLYDYLCKIKLSDTIDKYIYKFEKNNDIVRQKEYEAVWNILINVFEELHCVLGDKTLNVKLLKKYLYVALHQQSIGIIPTSVDEVIIGDIARTRTDKVKALVVIGANEGVFPVPSKDSGIISDNDKKLLSWQNINLSTTSSLQSFYNQFLIYRVFSMPDESIYVSYASADSNYNTLAPSFSVERIKKIFGINAINDSFEDIDNPDIITSSDVNYVHLATVMKNAKKGVSHIKEWDAVYNYLICNKKESIDKINSFIQHTNPIKPISADNVGINPDSMYTTISRLQQYKACHYSYFLTYMLNLTEKPQPKLKSLDLGTIVHDILEKICVGMADDNVTFKTANTKYFENKVDAYLNEYILQLGTKFSQLSSRELYSVKRLKNALVLCFEMIKKQIVSSKFEPMGYEIKFDDNNIGCIDIKLKSGKVLKITGKIDRADKYSTDKNNFIRVIDYKTGNKTFNLTDIVNGLDIQLMVYLNALVDGDSKNTYGGAFFFNLDDVLITSKSNMTDEEISKKVDTSLKLKGILADNDEVLNAFDELTLKNAKNKGTLDQFRKMSVYLKKLVADLWDEICKGNIVPNPYKHGNKSPCNYCPYSSVCRINSAETNITYNQIETLKNEDAWHIIMGGDNNGVDKKSKTGN